MLEKLKRIFRIKPKKVINNNFNEEKASAISDFVNYGKEGFVEQTEKVDDKTNYYIAKKYCKEKLVICEKLTTFTGKVLDGYPKYSVLTKNNDAYDFKIISENHGITTDNDKVENSIFIEYENANGYKKDQFYMSDIKIKNYSEDEKELVENAVNEIASFKKQKENELVR